jgi:hypothetical protein
MTKDEALKLALEFVSDIQRGKYKGDAEEVITAIKQALAATVQEPVAWMLPGTDSFLTAASKTHHGVRAESYTTPLYTTPPAAQPAVPEGWNLEIVETEFGDVRLTSPDGVAWRFRDTDGSDHFVWKFLTAMLTTPPAAQPAPVPLTDKQRQDVFTEADKLMEADDNLPWRVAILMATEQAHGITKGQPCKS